MSFSNEILTKVVVHLTTAAVLLLVSFFNLVAQVECNKCRSWQAKVDPQIKVETKINSKNERAPSKQEVIDFMSDSVIDQTQYSAIKSFEDSEVLEAMECLLKLNGKTHNSTIVGATRADTSQIFGTSTVEIASLYYISYLFYQNWGHAGAAVLTNKDGNSNSQKTTAAAYNAYKIWIKNVKKIGLEEARKRKLDPLAGSGVSWY